MLDYIVLEGFREEFNNKYDDVRSTALSASGPFVVFSQETHLGTRFASPAKLAAHDACWQALLVSHIQQSIK